MKDQHIQNRRNSTILNFTGYGKNPTHGVDNSVKRPGTGPFTTRGKHHTPSLYLYLLTITILDFLS